MVDLVIDIYGMVFVLFRVLRLFKEGYSLVDYEVIIIKVFCNEVRYCFWINWKILIVNFDRYMYGNLYVS